MKSFILEKSTIIIGVLLGAIAGFLYWKFIGCNSGSCAITSNPFNSTLYGSVMGGLIISMFKDGSTNKKD